MKIACIDKDHAHRNNLKKHIEMLFESCRDSIGHLPLAQIYAASREEILVNTLPDLFAICADNSVDETLLLAKELSNHFPDRPVIVFLPAEQFTFRNLKRFEDLANEIFALDETPVKVVHKLSAIRTQSAAVKLGRTIAIHGVKGGVGATTLVGGIAHACQAKGNSVVIVDLSPSGALLHYLATPKWNSPDFAAALLDGAYPDKGLVERCLVSAPNGIVALLPPLGGAEIREKWLRDASHFETGLTIIDQLKELFDLVLIDMAHVEGIFAYGITTRADINMLVSSNDPASVHLLNSQLTSLVERPGLFETKIVLNMLSTHGLFKNDILDFLYAHSAFSEEMLLTPSIKFDAKGSRWIGTANTFFTEGSAKTKKALTEITTTCLGQKQEAIERSSTARITNIFKSRKLITNDRQNQLALPSFGQTLKTTDDMTSLGSNEKMTTLFETPHVNKMERNAI